MNLKQEINSLLVGERPITDVYEYIIGNYRYKLYYSDKWHILLRDHIIQQIEYRISVMDKVCYDNGQCKICGCETTALQMANKSCDKPCYPPIMNRWKWRKFKKGLPVTIGKNVWIKNSKNKPQIINYV